MNSIMNILPERKTPCNVWVQFMRCIDTFICAFYNEASFFRRYAMLSIPYSRYLIYPIPWYSFLIVSGAALAIFLACREERRLGLEKDTIIDLSLILLPCGIVGARIYYVIFSWEQFRDDLVSVLRIWEGGLAIYGGIIAGLAALLLFSRFRRLSPLLLCDIIVPGLALAQSIGRWGNYFNIEAYGLQVTDSALCLFPLAVQVPAAGNSWHLATFFFESLWDFLVFLYLFLSRKKLSAFRGSIFYRYLFLYAAGRLMIEELRLDSLYASSSIRISQLLSVLVCIFVLARYLFRLFLVKRPAAAVRYAIAAASLAVSLALLIYSLFPSCFAGYSHKAVFIFLMSGSLSMMILFFIIVHHLHTGVPRHADQ